MKIGFFIYGVMVPLLWAVAGPVRAAGQCAELMNTVCLGCHTRDKFCERLGSTEKQWQSLIKWMIANGADLKEDQAKLLAGCLSGPAEEAKEFCSQ